MRRLSRREQIMIGLCAVVALGIGGPALWDALARRGPSAAQSKARLHAAQRERQAHAVVLARLERQVEQVADRRSPAALPAQVMTRLDRRARAEGIQLREVRPLPSRPLDGVTEVPLQLSFTAPFPQAAHFLARLRSDPDGLAVERVVIAATASDRDLVSVQARLSAFSLATGSEEGSRG
jgi:Tfp pilus assembly protein PilO